MNGEGESLGTIPPEVPIGTCTKVNPDGTILMEFNKLHPLYDKFIIAFATGGIAAVNDVLKKWQAARKN